MVACCLVVASLSLTRGTPASLGHHSSHRPTRAPSPPRYGTAWWLTQLRRAALAQASDDRAELRKDRAPTFSVVRQGPSLERPVILPESHGGSRRNLARIASGGAGAGGAPRSESRRDSAERVCLAAPPRARSAPRSSRRARRRRSARASSATSCARPSSRASFTSTRSGTSLARPARCRAATATRSCRSSSTRCGSFFH